MINNKTLIILTELNIAKCFLSASLISVSYPVSTIEYIILLPFKNLFINCFLSILSKRFLF